MNNNINLIENIYSTANLATTDHVVNKVQEIKGVLPKLLTGSTKKNIVIGMLDVLKLDAKDIMLDADNREVALKTALSKFEKDADAAKKIDEQSIADLEAQAKRIRDGISTRALDQADKRSIINGEIKAIKDVKNIVAL